MEKGWVSKVGDFRHSLFIQPALRFQVKVPQHLMECRMWPTFDTHGCSIVWKGVECRMWPAFDTRGCSMFWKGVECRMWPAFDTRGWLTCWKGVEFRMWPAFDTPGCSTCWKGVECRMGPVLDTLAWAFTDLQGSGYPTWPVSQVPARFWRCLDVQSCPFDLQMSARCWIVYFRLLLTSKFIILYKETTNGVFDLFSAKLLLNNI